MHRPFSDQRPLTLLLSDAAAAQWGAGIHRALDGIPHRFVHLDDAGDARGRHAVDIAFMTREVTANSGKVELAPTLARFYEIMRASPDLHWMQTHSAGTDRPIYGELRQRGVVVTTASGANAGPVAQMAATGVLLLARRFPALMAAQRQKIWQPLLGERTPIDLSMQTAMVVGMGRVGQEVARQLKAQQMRVIGVDIDDTPRPPADEVVAFTDVAGHWHRSDWVVLCCPLTEQTRALIDSAALARLPQGAHVVNVSRGEVIVEDDLLSALDAGHVAGAYLDVFGEEPLHAKSRLWDCPNVIVTPHTAGHTAGLHAAVARIFVENLSRWREGRPLRNAAA